MKDICEATQLSGEEELEVSQKSSLTRPFLSLILIKNICMPEMNHEPRSVIPHHMFVSSTN